MADNLALSLGHVTDDPVLLVDADLRRPSLHKLLGIDPPRGFVDVLAGRVALDEALVRPHDARLTFLACGRVRPEDAERVGGAAMERLGTDIRGMFAFAVFDAPPLPLIADAQLIGRHTDGALLVVRHGVTQRRAALKACDLLAHAGVPLLGCVVNDIRLNVPRYLAGFYQEYHPYAAYGYSVGKG